MKCFANIFAKFSPGENNHVNSSLNPLPSLKRNGRGNSMTTFSSSLSPRMQCSVQRSRKTSESSVTYATLPWITLLWKCRQCSPFQDVNEFQFPLFITSRQLLLMLDASLEPPYVFDRNENGSMKVIFESFNI